MKRFRTYIRESDEPNGHGAGEVMYRGNSGDGPSNPTGLYATTHKEFASGYGNVTAHKISPHARLLDMDHPRATHKLGYNASAYDSVKNPEARERYHLSDRLGAFAQAGAQDEHGEELRRRLSDAGYHGMSTRHGMEGHTRVFVLPGHHEDHKE